MCFRLHGASCRGHRSAQSGNSRPSVQWKYQTEAEREEAAKGGKYAGREEGKIKKRAHMINNCKPQAISQALQVQQICRASTDISGSRLSPVTA